MDVRERSTVKPELVSDDVTLDTNVECFICGQKGPLRRLTEHQMTAHSALQFVAAGSDAVICSICKYAMPIKSLKCHMKRKHPDEYSKIQKEKVTQMLVNRRMSSVLNEFEVPAPKSEHILKFEPVPKNNKASKKELQPKIEQIPPVFEQAVKKKHNPEPSIIQTRTVIVKTQSLLGVEEDDDGFFDLVITEFCED